MDANNGLSASHIEPTVEAVTIASQTYNNFFDKRKEAVSEYLR